MLRDHVLNFLPLLYVPSIVSGAFLLLSSHVNNFVVIYRDIFVGTLLAVLW